MGAQGLAQIVHHPRRRRGRPGLRRARRRAGARPSLEAAGAEQGRRAGDGAPQRQSQRRGLDLHHPVERLHGAPPRGRPGSGVEPTRYVAHPLAPAMLAVPRTGRLGADPRPLRDLAARRPHQLLDEFSCFQGKLHVAAPLVTLLERSSLIQKERHGVNHKFLF